MFVGMFKVMIMLHVACIKLGTTVEIAGCWVNLGLTKLSPALKGGVVPTLCCAWQPLVLRFRPGWPL